MRPSRMSSGTAQTSAMTPSYPTLSTARRPFAIYELANDATGKYSSQCCRDKKEGTIVSNESMDILRIFDGAFDALIAHPERKLFKAGELAAAEALNDFIYPTVNNGVYRCGFARSQEAYEAAHAELFSSLERLEAHLADHHAKGLPFLTGNDFTWIDLRLYHTLVRFDPVYVVYFKTSLKRIADFPHLLRFMRDCYAVPAVKESTNMRHIKMHSSRPHRSQHLRHHPGLQRTAARARPSPSTLGSSSSP